MLKFKRSIQGTPGHPDSDDKEEEIQRLQAEIEELKEARSEDRKKIEELTVIAQKYFQLEEQHEDIAAELWCVKRDNDNHRANALDDRKSYPLYIMGALPITMLFVHATRKTVTAC